MVSKRQTILSFRADNWRVDDGSDPVQSGGLSPFGKVSLERKSGKGERSVSQ